MNSSSVESTLTPVQRDLLSTYKLLIVILGVSGNSFVLFTSLRYKALNMDRISEVLLESIAVSDLVIILTTELPSLTSLIAGHWVLGENLCFFIAFFRPMPFFYQHLNVLMLGLYRAGTLKLPRAARLRLSLVPVRVLLLGACCVSLIPCVYWAAFSDNPQLNLASRISSCSVSFNIAEDLKKIIVMVFLISLPLTGTFVCNIYIIYIVVRQACLTKTRPCFRSILTILCVCWIYLFSFAPIFVDFILKIAGVYDVSPRWINILWSCTLSINSAVNPVIYLVTNSQYRRFVIRCFTINTPNQQGQTNRDHTT